MYEYVSVGCSAGATRNIAVSAVVARYGPCILFRNNYLMAYEIRERMWGIPVGPLGRGSIWYVDSKARLISRHMFAGFVQMLD